MHVLKQMGDGGHEQVVFLRDAGAGLTAIVAIHSTMLGPALGGTRMCPYATEEHALRVVVRSLRPVRRPDERPVSYGGGCRHRHAEHGRRAEGNEIRWRRRRGEHVCTRCADAGATSSLFAEGATDLVSSAQVDSLARRWRVPVAGFRFLVVGLRGVGARADASFGVAVEDQTVDARLGWVERPRRCERFPETVNGLAVHGSV